MFGCSVAISQDVAVGGRSYEESDHNGFSDKGTWHTFMATDCWLNDNAINNDKMYLVKYSYFKSIPNLN